ncbi:transposase family protein [Streptomyces sp. ISL-10]|uniref:transposase family protein n=1 Tax=Streptomyces sp. ISL-10 TaxID=2819172 RepID=UPI001BEB0E58|nr:transposase family protein [Streptomyces sp. ISL-10]
MQVKNDGVGGAVVCVVTTEDSTRACPSCGVFVTRLKDCQTTRPTHLSCGGRPVSIWWDKARWHCTEPACRRASCVTASRRT